MERSAALNVQRHERRLEPVEPQRLEEGGEVSVMTKRRKERLLLPTTILTSSPSAEAYFDRSRALGATSLLGGGAAAAGEFSFFFSCTSTAAAFGFPFFCKEGSAGVGRGECLSSLSVPASASATACVPGCLCYNMKVAHLSAYLPTYLDSIWRREGEGMIANVHTRGLSLVQRKGRVVPVEDVGRGAVVMSKYGGKYVCGRVS